VTQTGATVQLAEYLAKTNYQNLPGPVLEKTKELITDQLGVALASSTLPWNRKVLEYVQDNSDDFYT
jgi:2-methylcitrate dehydratase PrpD